MNDVGGTSSEKARPRGVTAKGRRCAARIGLLGLITLACTRPEASVAEPAMAFDSALRESMESVSAAPQSYVALCRQELARVVDDRSHLRSPILELGAATAQASQESAPSMLGWLHDLTDLYARVDGMFRRSRVLTHAHPDAQVRAEANMCMNEAMMLRHTMAIDPQIRSVAESAKVDELDDSAKAAIAGILLQARRSDLDHRGATQAKISQLRAEISTISATYFENWTTHPPRMRVRRAEARDLAKIISMPEPSGDTIDITVDLPTFERILRYSKDGEVRRRAWLAWQNRGHGINDDVLTRMVELRHELATSLGFADYAGLDAQDNMLDEADRVEQFLQSLVVALRPQAQRDYERLLARKRKSERDATRLYPWDAAYYTNVLATEARSAAGVQIREYLPLDHVRASSLKWLGERLGMAFEREDRTNDAWHPTVASYRFYDELGQLGRLHLDLHPRAGKFGIAASLAMTPLGARPGEHAILCNFPESAQQNAPVLLELEEVAMFLHELGHFVHNISSDDAPFLQLRGFFSKDFNEIPSVFLEQFAREPDVLRELARHFKDGVPLPEKLGQGHPDERVGGALMTMESVTHALLSHRLHRSAYRDRSPHQLYREIVREIGVFEPVDDCHTETSIAHLGPYASGVYVYLWSIVAARDLLTEYRKRATQSDPVRAFEEFREMVLVPSHHQHAGIGVRRYLGRDVELNAYLAWMRGDTDAG